MDGKGQRLGPEEDSMDLLAKLDCPKQWVVYISLKFFRGVFQSTRACLRMPLCHDCIVKAINSEDAGGQKHRHPKILKEKWLSGLMG